MNSHDVKKEDHFFAVLKEIRNSNLHAEERYSTLIHSITTTMCCSVFWDSITKTEFENRKISLLEEFEKQNYMKKVGVGPQHHQNQICYPWYDKIRDVGR